MGQFLRFAVLIILAMVGFGTGICGAWGLIVLVTDAQTQQSFAGVVAVIATICIVVAIGCFFGVRALARSIREHSSAQPGVPPPGPPPTTPPGPPPTTPPAAPPGPPAA